MIGGNTGKSPVISGTLTEDVDNFFLCKKLLVGGYVKHHGIFVF